MTVSRGDTLVAPATHEAGAADAQEVSALEGEMFNRLLASAAGLPRVCVVRKCRRAKRCFGGVGCDLPCLRHHRGLARARYTSALKILGWPNA